MKEKLQEYALVAEIIGGIAIVASLIFVGLQVQQTADETALNTRQMQAIAFQELSNQIIEINKLIISNPDLIQLSVEMGTRSDLNQIESAQRLGIYRILFRIGDTAHTQYKNGIITEEQLSSILVPVINVTANKAGLDAWHNEVGITAQFRDYFEPIITNSVN